MDGAEDTTGVRDSAAAADLPVGFERNLGPILQFSKTIRREGQAPHRRVTFRWIEEIGWPFVETIMEETKEWA